MHYKHACAFLKENNLFKNAAQNVSLLLLNSSVLKKYGSYYLCSSNGTLHTNLLIMKRHFKGLSQINTAPVHIVLALIYPLGWNQALLVKNISYE
jgi:hypothetical protein